jgi:hypothetical protein
MGDKSYRFEGTGQQIGVPHNSEYRYVHNSQFIIHKIPRPKANPVTNIPNTKNGWALA